MGGDYFGLIIDPEQPTGGAPLFESVTVYTGSADRPNDRIHEGFLEASYHCPKSNNYFSMTDPDTAVTDAGDEERCVERILDTTAARVQLVLLLSSMLSSIPPVLICF